MKNTQETLQQKRWYVIFCNPQTGNRDELWFESIAAREQWMKDFRSDFPLMQMATLEDIVRIQVEADYSGQRITSDSIECIIDNRVQNWHVDQNSPGPSSEPHGWPVDGPSPVRCLDCGTPVPFGEPCPTCGLGS